jgi:hypothetical protein
MIVFVGNISTMSDRSWSCHAATVQSVGFDESGNAVDQIEIVFVSGCQFHKQQAIFPSPFCIFQLFLGRADAISILPHSIQSFLV